MSTSSDLWFLAAADDAGGIPDDSTLERILLVAGCEEIELTGGDGTAQCCVPLDWERRVRRCKDASYIVEFAGRKFTISIEMP